MVVAVTLAACSEPEPAPSPPKAVRPVTQTTLTGTAGKAVEGGVTVRVVDYSERNLAGAKVGFSVVGGDGTVSHRLVITDDEGLAHTEWTLGQTAGFNEVTANIFGVDSTARFIATGVAGAPAAISITPRVLRIPSTSGGGSLAGSVVDEYGNVIAGSASFVSRDPAVATVTQAGSVTAQTRGTSTYVVVTAGGFTDSSLVVLLTSTDPPCTGITAIAQLAVGDVQTTGFLDNGICVAASAGEREYALVPFLDTPGSERAERVHRCRCRGQGNGVDVTGRTARPRSACTGIGGGEDGHEARGIRQPAARVGEERDGPARC